MKKVVGEITVKTGVDKLLDLLKTVDKISVQEAAKRLDVPLQTLQSWVDFLVEENVIGVEYNFTSPFIYLNKAPEESLREQPVQVKHKRASLNDFYQEFKRLGLEKKIPLEKIDEFWNERLMTTLENVKDYFYREARKRGFKEDEIQNLWKEYKAQVLTAA
ncbi:hypothetical protein J7L02_01725 [Candidatus Woesearchaeota archaeon]|nr:hypothetical protein [Candidatus Woesearchaeota archaeon]